MQVEIIENCPEVKAYSHNYTEQNKIPLLANFMHTSLKIGLYITINSTYVYSISVKVGM